MLAPLSYERDLKRLFNQCVNHKPQNWKSLQKLREITKPIWNKSYPQEPYDPPSKENSKTNFQSSFDYDISEAIQRQKLLHSKSCPFANSLKNILKVFQMIFLIPAIFDTNLWIIFTGSFHCVICRFVVIILSFTENW